MKNHTKLCIHLLSLLLLVHTGILAALYRGVKSLSALEDMLPIYTGQISGSVRAASSDTDSHASETSDFLSIHMAAAYLLTDTETLEHLLEEGYFAGTYILLDDEYLFLKDKLYDWCSENTVEK